MRWRVEKPGAEERTLAEWHKWFAWYPVKLDDTTKVWLCTVQRKGTSEQAYEGGLDWTFIYKEVVRRRCWDGSCIT